MKADKLGLYTNVKPDRKKRYAAWTVNELNFLTKYYPIIRPKAMVLLPGRTEAACCSMAQKIGIAQSSTGLWSESELTILKGHYPQMGPEISSLLPFRNTDGITSMAMKMGIPGPDRSWTADDDEILKAQYPHMSSSVASLLDGRYTGDACIQRARFLGLSRPTEERMWSDELEILKENYHISQADVSGEAVRPEDAGDHVNKDATAYAVMPTQIVEEPDETQQDQNESVASRFGILQMQ